MVALAVAVLVAPAVAQTSTDEAPAAPAVIADDGPVYSIAHFRIRYLRDNPLHPTEEEILALPIDLARTPTGWVAPQAGLETQSTSLAALASDRAQSFHASALQSILVAILRHYQQVHDFLGVYVAPDPDEISRTGNDLRPTGDADLTILVTTGLVSELRTVASGERVHERGDITPETRIDNSLHKRIIERSPVRPYRGGGKDERHDLLRKSVLDNYLFHLGRHPGRRVDASLAAAQDIGGVALDYLVTENRPLVLYAQASNTGTAATDHLRTRFGLFHTQLTNYDDILSLDYMTSFSEVKGFTGSYDRPFEDDRIRWRIEGTWDEYNAEEVGFFSDIFTGTSWSFGGSVRANVYQDRELFVDLLGGLRYYDVETDNQAFAIHGEQDFLIPFVGVQLERATEWEMTNALVALDFQIGDLTDVNEAELTKLGRLFPSRDWAVLRWNVWHSVYLEPLLDREGWEDPTTPEDSTLAHEVRASFRGQYAFDDRLIPQIEHVIGGMETVRGYPQSAVAGDTALIGSIEYRYHLPRTFAVQPDPAELFGKPFRAAPQYIYGTPDWDLILKAFFDVGQTIVSDPLPFEEDETLVGAGIGFEFLFKRNFNLRLDWGFALQDLDSRGVEAGDEQLYVVATLMF